MQVEEKNLKKEETSASEDELDDAQTIEEPKSEKMEKAKSIENNKKDELNYQKLKELRKKFRDKPFLVKGEFNIQ